MLGVYLDLHSYQIGSSQLQEMILWMNCLLPLAGICVTIWQIGNLINERKRWFAIAALLMLFIALCVAVTMRFLLAKWGMMF
jgi:phage-related holin